MENPNKKHILNADESFARSNQISNFTWTRKGSDDVYVNIDFR